MKKAIKRGYEKARNESKITVRKKEGITMRVYTYIQGVV